MKDPDNLLRKVAAPVAATIIAMLIVVAGWVFVVPRIPDVIPGIGSTTQDIESESAKAEESKKAERPSTRTPWGDPALEEILHWKPKCGRSPAIPARILWRRMLSI